MNKLLVALLISLTTLDASAAFRSSSFSRSSGFSRPSKPSYRPSTPAPRPVVINRTTVVHNNSTTSAGGGGTGFLGTIVGAGLGSYVGNKLAQPTPVQQAAPAAPQPQYFMCPRPIPKGWNTPCIPYSE